MRKIRPIKWIAFNLLFFTFLPITIAIILVITLENKGEGTIALLIFFFGIPIPIWIFIMRMDVCILIDTETGDVTNQIMYNHDSWEWTRNLKSNTRDIFILDKKDDIGKFIKHPHKPRKLLVITFLNKEQQFIPLTMFTKRQIQMILSKLDSAR
ncbi:MAG: hypothetical protein FWE36_08020 [Erysipelotrichales bacterium]|nr:hypothetical protein [Erysipelotrichales bacterium]